MDCQDIIKDGKAWKKTMEDLLEQPEYIDTANSANSQTGLLAKAAREFAREEKLIERDVIPEHGSMLSLTDENRYMKNLIVLSISFMFVFTAYTSLRNLQSSLSHEGGLGMYALSSVYGSLFIGCLFSPTIVQRFRPKNTMVASLCGMFIYSVSNFYPAYYTLIPACCITGFSLANLWTAHATYMTNTAIRYAELTSKPLQNVLSRFNGIFFMFFQFATIIGGVISSLVLMSEPVHHLPNQNGSMEISMENSIMDNISLDLGLPNKAFCGAKYCHSDAVDDFSVDIDKNLVYILVGVYSGCALLGIIIIATCLDKLDVSILYFHGNCKCI